MKLELNKQELQQVKKIFDVDDKNCWIADFFIDVTIQSKDIQSQAIKSKNVYQTLVDYYSLNNKFFNNAKNYHLKDNIYLLNAKEYKNNPYVKNIHIENVKDGKWAFKLETFEPYEPFLFTDIQVDKEYYEITKLGYFNESYSYLTVSYDDEIWMLITPHEMNTMKEAIENAKGDVITFGLGLGYFAYMASIKNEVSSVTIVEKDPTIIELFKKHILPKFDHKEKITIIQDDALAFMDKGDFHYDYAFVDLWHDTEDGLLLYIYIRQKASQHKKTVFSYWIEKSMVIMLRRCLINILYEQINNEEVAYLDEDNEYEHIMNQLYFILKDYKISSYNDVTTLLSDQSILSLINKIK